MQLTSVELWQRITQLGLATLAECRSWAAEAAKSFDVADATDGILLLRQLIKLGHLSKYQAQILLGQAHGPVRRGDWLIVEPVADRIWPNWLVVSPSDRAAVPTQRWARWLSSADLHRLRASAPSLRRAALMQKIRHDHLQSIEQAQAVEGKLEIVVEPLEGQLLSENIADKLSTDGGTVLVRQIAGALAALHAAGVVHGRVLPDRIYIDGERATLASDPLASHTAMLDSTVQGLLATQLGSFHTAQFIAPEFLAPGQTATPATDCYSLGCVWWTLLTGTPPNQGNDTATAMAAHARPAARLPAACKLAEPLRRCLEHLLAKNPDARFASAIEFCAAFDAAQQILADSASSNEAPTAKTPTAQPQSATKIVPHKTSVQPSSRPSVTARRTRQRRKSKWLLPMVGGCCFLIVLLLALKFSGALQPGNDAAPDKKRPAAYQPPPSQPPTPTEKDPRERFYNSVASNSGQLWLPPVEPAPLPLDLLPPGGQFFISLHPAAMLNSPTQRGWLSAFDAQLGHYLNGLSQLAGQPLENIQHATIACYSPLQPGGPPQCAARIELASAVSLGELQTAWGSPANESVGEHVLLVAPDASAYYVQTQPLVQSQSVAVYSVGPTDLMRDTAQMQGAAGPLMTQIEKLWQHSSAQLDLSILYSPAYLSTDGRWLLQCGPKRLQAIVRTIMGTDLRAGLVQMSLEPQWYVELQWIAQSDREAAEIASRLEAQMSELSNSVERWLVANTPHPAWRALALRFPQMLGVLREFTRIGVEDGVALANVYLPSEAATNLMLTTWLAVQDAATESIPTTTTPAAVAPPQPLSIDAYLARRIRVSFDQEPIEVALQMVSDEANDRLPTGTSSLRFVLDGDAFENGGITRNQQLKDFRHDGLPVRDALTEIARRGNPVTTVTDTRQTDQKLIWVVTPDPANPATMLISLTTRAAALAAGIELPVEFRSDGS